MDRPFFLDKVGFDVMKEHFMRVNGCSIEGFNEYYQQHEEEAESLVSLGTGKIIWWRTDYGQHLSIVAQPGNLKRGFVWRDGYIGKGD